MWDQKVLRISNLQLGGYGEQLAFQKAQKHFQGQLYGGFPVRHRRCT
jgi:hypothetical protein